jgi:hypothetical protein
MAIDRYEDTEAAAAREGEGITGTVRCSVVCGCGCCWYGPGRGSARCNVWGHRRPYHTAAAVSYADHASSMLG